jgi:hypothetical protein
LIFAPWLRAAFRKKWKAAGRKPVSVDAPAKKA